MSARLRTSTAVAIAALTITALAGCKSTTSKPAAGSTHATSAGTGAGTPTTPAKLVLPTGGRCVLLTIDQATSLLGSKPKASSTGLKGDDKVVHVDGCTYVGSGDSLGYDINEYVATGLTPQIVVQQAIAAIGQAPGAKKFDVSGGDAAIGFTMPVGPKTMARIEVAKGRYSVAVLATDADPAKAKQIALAAVAVLVTAVS